MAATRRVRALLGLALLVGACTAPPAVSQPFVKSEAFHAMSGVVYGIVEQDINGDGLRDALVAKQVGPGYAVSALVQRQKDGKASWDEVCTGPLALGEELVGLRWTRIGQADVLLLVVSEDNPEEMLQSYAVVDPAAGCHALLSERLSLAKPEHEVLAPESVPAGVTLLPEGGLRIIDQPYFVTLQGAAGPVQILSHVRERNIRDLATDVAVEPSTHVFLQRATTTATWQPEAGDALPLPEVGDGDETTMFVLRPGEVGTLHLTADLTLVLLELHHGCSGAAAEPLTIAGPDGAAVYVTGEPPAPDSFIRAAGRRRVPGALQDLLALRAPGPRVTLGLRAGTSPVCIREARGFGWADPAAAPLEPLDRHPHTIVIDQARRREVAAFFQAWQR